MNIKCKNLSIGYGNNVLHENINFTIKSGSYTCMIGENGAGKSTLMKTLLGLTPSLKGEIIIGEGLNATDIGYLPQQTRIQKDFPASVYEVVLSGCLNKVGFRPFYNKAEKKLAKDNLERLGITHLTKKSYSDLSGGQQQRVLLARALCATSKVLLLDEPTTGLDYATTKDFYKLIKKLNVEGITIIMITHRLDDSLEDATHVLSVLESGVKYQDKNEYVKERKNG